MSGIEKGAQRDELLAERDARIIEQMKRGVPIRSIAIAEGLEADYAGKICARLADQHAVNYQPEGKRQAHENAVPLGLSELTNRFRRNAATKLYLWKINHKKHFLEVCRDTGLTQAAQRSAEKAHGPYDWHLSQLDRWATAMGVSFEDLMLELMFDPATAARMKACLNQK